MTDLPLIVQKSSILNFFDIHDKATIFLGELWVEGK